MAGADRDEGRTVRELLTWFLETEDEVALGQGLARIPPAVWPGFSAEAAAEIRNQEHARFALHRHLLGEERRRREY